jgi:hypothetical protein
VFGGLHLQEGRTLGLHHLQQAEPAAWGLGLNPSLQIEHSSSIASFGRLDLYLREHFVCNSIIVLKPSEAIPDLLLSLYQVLAFL